MTHEEDVIRCRNTPGKCTCGVHIDEWPRGYSADIDPTGAYRYSLTRRWEDGGALCCWIMLNPSTADASVDDPTIRRCIGFTKRLGWPGIHVINLFALRATNPATLSAHPDPVGPDNDVYIYRAIMSASIVIAAWGVLGGLRERAGFVRLIANERGVPLFHFGLTKNGQPKHPLYLPNTTVPKMW